MKCPACGAGQTKVIGTERTDHQVIRLRQCLAAACRYVWKTTEAVDPEYRKPPRRAG